MVFFMAEIPRKWKIVLSILIVFTIIISVYLLALSPKPAIEVPESEQTINPIAVVNTTMGEFRIELFEKEFRRDNKYNSLELIENFKRYSASGFYDGLIIHGVTPWPYNKTKTLIWTGEYNKSLQKKELLYPPIKYGKRTDTLFGLKHTDLMVSWYDTWNITSTFYICNGDWSDPDNPQESWKGPGLDPVDPVFGKVISGVSVIRNIGSLPTHSEVNSTGDKNLGYVPNETVMIRHIYIFYPKDDNETALYLSYDSYLSSASFFTVFSSFYKISVEYNPENSHPYEEKRISDICMDHLHRFTAEIIT